MLSQNGRHSHLRFLFLWVVLWGFFGCSSAPNIYTMPPREVENIRAGLGTVGVILVTHPPKTEVLMPAKGFWGGVKRGVAVGATLPIMVGFVSPIPGGTLLGAVVAPFTAVFGAVYGAAKAAPVREVEDAEMALQNAAGELRQLGLAREFFEEVVGLGNDRTGLVFVALPDMECKDPDKDVSYHRADFQGIDTILELKTQKVGLRGDSGIDPKTDTFMQMRVRLIRVEGDLVLMEETFYCMSEEEKTFKEWASGEGQSFVDEFRSCVPEMAEKIVDDLFLVYPLSFR